MKRLLVVAAGTGGHVMPGLAIAGALQGRGWQVSWLGTRTGMEGGLVAQRGIPFDAIDFAGLRGKGLGTLLAGGFTLLRALWQSQRVLRARAPDVVFATGGYVAVPAGLAAGAGGVPLVLLNADAAPLLSTRLLQPLAAGVLCGFEGAAARRAGAKGIVTGNPVRPEVVAVGAARMSGMSGAHLGPAPLCLLVIGGSLGAQALNAVVPAALAQLPVAGRPRVVHQCGARHLEATRAAYAAAGVAAEIVAFIDDIAPRYAGADVAVCRAGAITVSELCAAALPAILVPLIARTTDHQRANAELLAASGAALHLPQAQATAARLADLLRALDRPRLAAMAARAHGLARPDATRTAADVIEHVAARMTLLPARPAS
jgi:UDP-N-acetylglucosamine--N-acetylmuramyl-(pentapeptide) pyrophosphoryl-undecaprenol N-acetylglucosamine transferase